MQDLEPAVFLEHTNDVERIVFVSELLRFIAELVLVDVLDVIAFPCGVVAGLCSFLELPMEARGKAGGPDQARGLFEEGVVVENADELKLDVGEAVEWVEKQ